MAQAFLRLAIPVLYVYDQGEVPEEAPGFSMAILPVISRSLKEHAGTSKVTVITGTPAPANMVDEALTHLALQYAHLEKASPEAGSLLAAEFIAENFDGEAVLGHLKRILEEQQREIAEDVASRFGRVDVEAGPVSDEDVSAGDPVETAPKEPAEEEEESPGEPSAAEGDGEAPDKE